MRKSRLNNPDTLSSNWLSFVKEDSSGLLWISMDEVGLSQFDPVNEIFTHYMPDETRHSSLSNGVVNSLFEDSQGTIWIGTNEMVAKFGSNRDLGKVHGFSLAY